MGLTTVYTSIKSRGKDILIYALLSGFIAEKKSSRNVAGRLLNSEFREMQPVWVFLIVHPDEGLILVDTGQHPHTNHPDYFKPAGRVERWFLKTQFQYSIEQEHNLEEQLKKIGYGIKDISMVVLTHLHFDHTGNLPLFKKTRILLSKAEWVDPFYAVQALHPLWFQPELILFGEKEPAADNLLEGAFMLGSSADLFFVSTPGHTNGHASVMVLGDDTSLLLAGDVSATQKGLFDQHSLSGEANAFQLKMSRWKITDYARHHPLIYLPSHDPEIPERMKKQTILHLAH